MAVAKSTEMAEQTRYDDGSLVVRGLAGDESPEPKTICGEEAGRNDADGNDLQDARGWQHLSGRERVHQQAGWCCAGWLVGN